MLVRTVLYLAFVTGLAIVAGACRTNTAGCDAKRAAANEIRDAAAKCEGMRDYLSCVEADIADCEPGATDANYPKNLVNMFCSDATLCSSYLSDCYENFTSTTVSIIMNSDDDQRQALCSSLAVSIMSCTDRVAASCNDQPGLLETVAKRQETFNATCGQTVPCVYHILQCQSPIMDMTKTTTTTTGPQSATQASQDSQCRVSGPDYCTAYRQSLECMNNSLQDCVASDIGVSNILKSLQESTDVVCSANQTCPREYSACICLLNISPTDPFSGICANWPAVQNCMNNMPTECLQLPTVTQDLALLQRQYGMTYNTFCSMSGVCPAAFQCLSSAGLSMNPGGSNGGTDQSTPPVADLDLNMLCERVRPIFGCLASASSTCGVEQGEATFPQVEDKFVNLCQAMIPHAEALATCDEYTRCSLSFEGFPNMTGLSSSNPDLAAGMQAMVNMLRAMTSTEMWCSYLTHGSKCLADTAASCKLPSQFGADMKTTYEATMEMCGITPDESDNSGNPGNNQGGSNTGQSSGNDGTGGAQTLLQSSALPLLTIAFLIAGLFYN